MLFRSEEALAMVGLAHACDLQVRKMSLGMRQRLGIARACLGPARHLLLDEPTNGLDPLGIRDAVVGMGLVLSVIMGGGIGYVLCSFLKNSLMSYLNYQFPLGITILNCAVIILCSVLITTGALKQQSKSSMMEALR